MKNDKCTGRIHHPKRAARLGTPVRSRFCNRAPSLSVLPIIVSFFSVGLINPATANSDQQIFIRVNQLGYRPLDPKSGVAFSREALPENFAVIDSVTEKVVFDGPTKPIGSRWGQFDHHAELDFSAWQKPGKYFVRIGDVTSLPFEISNSAYRDVPDELLEFMREQRCGYNPWLDAVCHPFDGRTAYGPLPAGTYLNATGGWHDAGDQLKYLLTSSNATAQMLLAYQMGATSSALLAEARWGLDWMLKLHPAPDQLYHQVADDRDHIGWRLPQNEKADYGWCKGGARVVYFADGQPQCLQQCKRASTGLANLAGRHASAMAL